jgi:hypothetical protein
MMMTMSCARPVEKGQSRRVCRREWQRQAGRSVAAVLAVICRLVTAAGTCKLICVLRQRLKAVRGI